MTIKNILEIANINLKNSGIENYFFESRELLSFVLGKSKEWIMCNLDYELLENDEFKFNEVIKLRCNNIPFQYILGYQYFMGNKFKVNSSVLIPRADTEILVYEVLKLSRNTTDFKMLDMCTGSGCIAISLSKMLPNTLVYGVDISEDALNVAKENSTINNTKINFINSNLFENMEPEKFDIIISNPPYITTKDLEKLALDVKNEPILALDGGNDGLYFYKEISKKARDFLNVNGYLAYEIGYNQADEVKNILENLGYKDIFIIKDYSNNDRVIIAKYKG